MNNSQRKRCFPPMVDDATQVLILGSLPGDASLRQQQYYGHPQNQFWRLLGDVLQQSLPQQAYAARLACMLEHGLGLWDVIAEASRPGSLDAAIRAQSDNDLPALLAMLPQLRLIAFNGGTAAKLGRRQLQGVNGLPELLDLPSSSAAYTLPYANKLQQWLSLRSHLQALG